MKNKINPLQEKGPTMTDKNSYLRGWMTVILTVIVANVKKR